MPSSKPVWERRAWSAPLPGASPPGGAQAGGGAGGGAPVMPSSKPVWERRALSASFPGLSPPGEAEGWAEEAYLLPLGLGGRNIKISGDALEMKDLVVARPDMQLWHPAARLTFPVPSASLERELIARLAPGDP